MSVDVRIKKEGGLLMGERIIEHTINNIKVTIHIPENVSESVKRNRINQIYDILKPDKEDKDKSDNSDKTA